MSNSTIERKLIELKEAPRFVRELLKDIAVTIPIAKSFDAVEAVLLESQRNITKDKSIPRDEMPAAVAAIGHMLQHLQLFRDQGKLDAEFVNRRGGEA